jgi:hypothetical protein
MEASHARQVPVYNLLPYGPILKQLASYGQPILRCNFDTRQGWVGKPVISNHDLDSYKPSGLTGTMVLGSCGYIPSDYVVLTEDQYRDYKAYAEDRYSSPPE